MNRIMMLYTELEQFGISSTRGFLSTENPIQQLNIEARFDFSRLEKEWLEQVSICGRDLSRWLSAGCVRREFEKIFKDISFGKDNIEYLINRISSREHAWLMRTLSFLTSAWVWGGIGEGHTDRIPTYLAIPFCAIAKMLGRPPILSYDSYAPQNWYRFDSEGLIELGNIGVIQNFYGGLDENWFILVHVDIEAKAGPISHSALKIAKTVASKNFVETYAYLCKITYSLGGMIATMKRMTEGCDPEIYFNRARPYIHGWQNTAFTNGVTYDGSFENKPQQFLGETGAQSAIFPILYALLGVKFNEDGYLKYLHEMREYMPPGHWQFIEFLEEAEQNEFSVIQFAKEHNMDYPQLTLRIKEVLYLMIQFLEIHIEYAASYIQKQAQKIEANSTTIGTGGTPFMTYLKAHINCLKKMRDEI